MAQATGDLLDAGREALGRHAWQEAFELLSEADRAALLSASDLASLAEAAWWAGRIDDAMAGRERAYAAYLEEGERSNAAMVALLLARDHRGRGEGSQAGAWTGRAERLLENEPESAAHGWMVRMRARGAFEAGQFQPALELCEEALQIGMRLRDQDLQAMALQGKGEALVSLGHVEEGRALQDEATVAAVSGELSPFVTGLIYCNVIADCADLGDYGRAGEWTEAARRWCERQSITGFPGVCRVHRAEIMRLRGSWAEAADEAQQACTELEGHGLLALAGEAFNELGHIRLRMGDLPAAADAFRQANELGQEPQPGLALLRLAEGKVDQARASIERALDTAGADRLRRAKLLPLRAQLAGRAGDLTAARAATEELEEIAEDVGTTAFHARALESRGVLVMAEGRPAEAIAILRRARGSWTEIDLPYEAAATRELLGEAYRAAGDEDAATLELDAARSSFERLGAVLDARRVTGLLGEADAAAVAPSRVERAFMFTDIVRSTNLVEAIGDEAWTDLVRWHDQALREGFERHGGEEVDHAGDGFFVAFESATRALECAVEIQQRLADHRRAAGFAPQVRIGVHVAEAAHRGGDYLGRGVHEAARVGALAEGGEIVVSAATLRAAGAGFTGSDARSVTLKGFAQPVDVVSVEWR
jgi:class 3 adenylate cyclase